MADEMKRAKAEAVYELLCTALEHREWTFDKVEEDLVVRFVVNGDDMPLQFVMLVEEEKELLTLLSPLPFKMSESKRMDGAIAACAVSCGMADGSFDYDISEGGIAFRLVVSYRGSILSEGVLQYMISCSCAMVDQYNDRFLALNKGILSVEDFFETT